MKEWNYEKLEQMTEQENEFVQIRLNYIYIAENYEEMFIKTYENGDLIPTMFEDVNIAYPGKAENDIKIAFFSNTKAPMPSKAIMPTMTNGMIHHFFLLLTCSAINCSFLLRLFLFYATIVS